MPLPNLRSSGGRRRYFRLVDASWSYDEIAVTYESRKRGMELAPWSERLLQRRAVSLPGRASVLDVGCGHGFEVERMRRDFGLNPTGIDLSLGMLRLARTRTDGRVAQADATRLPLRTESVQGVWSMHTLLHVLDLGAALAEMRRVLQPAGVAAFTIALGERAHRGACRLSARGEPAIRALVKRGRGRRGRQSRATGAGTGRGHQRQRHEVGSSEATVGAVLVAAESRSRHRDDAADVMAAVLMCPGN